MPKVSPEHMQARRDQIARAAIDEFAQRGIHSTSMVNIIKASGLSAGAIYTHFSSKDEIIAYVAQTTFSGLFAGVEAVASLEPPPRPSELAGLITWRISEAEIPTGLLVQVWGEAVSNSDVREAVNAVYARALTVLREYYVLWLTTSEGEELRAAQQQAAARARLLVSLIYAQILQMSLIEGHDTKAFNADLGELLDPAD